MKKHMVFLLLLLFWPAGNIFSWGFYAHQRINRLAVFTLPPEIIGFYKKHIIYITENAVNPDKRRYVVKAEGPRHFIDLDVYGDSAQYKLPRNWPEAVAKFGEDSLAKHGVLPWHLNFVKYQLTEAFKHHDVPAILRLSADLGHYLADACVPLHTTRNYNGQFTNQHGIHGFWESRLPELLAGNYDFFVGPAAYVEKPQQKAWDIIIRSHAALDSVLRFEKEVAAQLPEDKKYTFEERNNITVKTYSKAYTTNYHQKLKGQVERQMRYAVWLVGSFWYTCWVDAGQPDLNNLQPLTEAQKQQLAAERQQLKQVVAPDRPHEAE
ncbi:zinc dependent phospholipase C family protein [Adhaeribacter rhizoryzae]|uniref:S1/P1 Nuclease n=1 Tax=Adhaeribacter rhizoryzae TaxID=2607907 RepID=A0A5M6DDL0_9BACT|nr:zinc dependent phospholipase C family protein [Adhaeribacter rhizoryzae]KAA5545651.1 S1/P1 Nuclease [Adhaeribacter rhizoryzae]